MSNNRNLTAKQERFAQLVASGRGQSEAYRDCYSTKNMKSSSIHRNAKALIDNTKISSRLVALRYKLIEQIHIDINDLVLELLSTIELARQCRQPSAIVSAVREIGKLLDLYPNPRKSFHLNNDELVIRIQNGRLLAAANRSRQNDKTQPKPHNESSRITL